MGVLPTQIIDKNSWHYKFVRFTSLYDVDKIIDKCEWRKATTSACIFSSIATLFIVFAFWLILGVIYGLFQIIGALTGWVDNISDLVIFGIKIYSGGATIVGVIMVTFILLLILSLYFIPKIVGWLFNKCPKKTRIGIFIYDVKNTLKEKYCAPVEFK
jgi:hypothetical protein